MGNVCLQIQCLQHFKLGAALTLGAAEALLLHSLGHSLIDICVVVHSLEALNILCLSQDGEKSSCLLPGPPDARTAIGTGHSGLGREASAESSWVARRKSEAVGKLWVLLVYFQEPADSSLSGLIAEEPGPRTELLAGRPQGNESYRDGVRIIVAAS